MDYIKIIDQYINDLKNKEQDKLDKCISAFYEINAKNESEYKKVDLNELIKNIIIANLLKLSEEDFDKTVKLLKEKDFSYLYDSYAKLNRPRKIQYIEVVIDEYGNIFSINSGKKAFSLFNIENLYVNESYNSNNNKNFKVLKENIEKQNEEIKKDLFKEDFLKDILPDNFLLDEPILNMISCCINDIYEISFEQEDIDNLKKEFYKFYNNKKPLRSLLNFINITRNIKASINFIKETIVNLEMDKKKKIREQKSIIKLLEKNKMYILKLKEDLSYLDKIDFELLSKIDENMYKYIFEDLFKHQEEVYKKVTKNYSEAKEAAFNNQLQNLFSSVGIDYNKLDDSIKNLLLNSEEKVDKLKSNMRELKISSQDNINYQLINFLLNALSSEIKFCSYCLKNKIISRKTLLENPEILKSDSFLKNIAIIKDNKLSFDSANYDDRILFKDEHELSRNNELLKAYAKKNDSNNYMYLYDSYYFDLLDFLLERELETTLLDDYSISLSDVDNFIKRYVICDSLNIPIYTDSYSLKINFLLGNNFYVDEDRLDDYILRNNYEDEKTNNFIKGSKRNIISADIFDIEEFKKLESFKSNNGLYYDISGIIISRIKVIRNLSLFYGNNLLNNRKNFLAAIIYNSYLTDEEVQLIQEVIYANSKKHV